MSNPALTTNLTRKNADFGRIFVIQHTRIIKIMQKANFFRISEIVGSVRFQRWRPTLPQSSARFQGICGRHIKTMSDARVLRTSISRWNWKALEGFRDNIF